MQGAKCKATKHAVIVAVLGVLAGRLKKVGRESLEARTVAAVAEVVAAPITAVHPPGVVALAAQLLCACFGN